MSYPALVPEYLEMNDIPSIVYNCDLKCLVQGFHEFRLNNKLTDIVLKVGDREFPAHRLVLANSDLSGISFDDLTQTVYELDREFVNPEIVENLLTFLYTHKITFSTTTLIQPIVEASMHLKMKLLHSVCEQLFIDCVKKCSRFKFYEYFFYSVVYKFEKLKNHSIEHILNNIEDPEFRKTLWREPGEHINMLLHELSKRNISDNIKENFLALVFEWARQDFSNRKWLLSKFVRKIHVTQNHFYYFCFQIISNSHPCSNFLVKALKRTLNYSELLYFTNDSLPLKIDTYFTTNPDHVLPLGTRYLGSRIVKTNVYNQCGAVIDRKVYLFGGKIENCLTDKACMMDFWSETSMELQSMPYKGQQCAAAVCNGSIYVTGGRDETAVHSKAYCYNVQVNKWTMVKPMNYPRFKHRLVVFNGRLYAIGGCFRLPNQNKIKLKMETSTLKKVEEYNPSTKEWRTVASLNYHHEKVLATVHCGKIYVCSDSGFEVYSPQWNDWKKLASYDRPNEIFSLESIEDKLYAFGNETRSYDVEKNRWNHEFMNLIQNDLLATTFLLVNW